MRLTILVDVITISACVAIILVASDYRTGDAAKDSAHGRTGACADAWENRTGDSSSARADDCSSCCGGDLVIGGRVGCAPAEREAAHGSG